MFRQTTISKGHRGLLREDSTCGRRADWRKRSISILKRLLVPIEVSTQHLSSTGNWHMFLPHLAEVMRRGPSIRHISTHLSIGQIPIPTIDLDGCGLSVFKRFDNLGDSMKRGKRHRRPCRSRHQKRRARTSARRRATFLQSNQSHSGRDCDGGGGLHHSRRNPSETRQFR
jgi:hypothetical protein